MNCKPGLAHHWIYSPWKPEKVCVQCGLYALLTEADMEAKPWERPHSHGEGEQ